MRMGSTLQGSPRTVCGLATLTSWGLLPPLPLLVISTELPVWVNLGIFFWGIVLLHDPQEQATPALLARCPRCGLAGPPCRGSAAAVLAGFPPLFLLSFIVFSF